MATGAPLAAGERSVSVGGDIVGSLIVTGDNNNLNLVLGQPQGALLEQLTRGVKPVKRQRRAPLRSVPTQFPDSLDRGDEERAILDAVASGTPVNVYGPAGIGKTYAILRALNADNSALADGAVYLYAPGPLDDVLQLMFEAWYECDPPFKPSTSQLRADLARVRGVVALDSIALPRDAAQQLPLSAPGCQVLVVSRDRVLFEGTSIAVRGLAAEYATDVLEYELGRRLAAAERDDAQRVCIALQGHPLKVREAVATMRDAGRSLSDLAVELSAGEADAALSRDKLLAAGEDGRKLVAALALFDGATVGKDHLRAIADVDDFESALMAALSRRDLRSHSPRYSLAATIGAGLGGMDLTAVGGRALEHFTRWVVDNRSRASTLMTEASAMLALLRWAVRSGRFRAAIALGRAVDHAFALERRFGGWGQVLEVVHAAALAAGDRESEAWALHQMGTRAICLGDLAAGAAMLGQAIELRRKLGDTGGAGSSAHNLMFATHPRPFWRWIVGHSLLMALVLVLLAGGIVAAATLPGSTPQPSPVTTASVHSSRPPGHTGSSGGPSTGGSSGGSTSPTTRSLTVSISGVGSVMAGPGAKSCLRSCVVLEPVGSTVTLTAQPAGGSLLASWSGQCSASGPTCTATMSGDLSVTASFSPAVSLTVDLPNGGSLTSDRGNIDCPGTCSSVFPVQSTVTLTASGLAFWPGAPNCPQPAASASSGATGATGSSGATGATGATGTPDGVSGKSSSQNSSSSTTTTTTQGGILQLSTSVSSNKPPPPSGSQTCSITLDKSYAVSAVVASP